MKVSDLQQHLSDLAKLLQSTDARKTAEELGKIAQTLAPFRDHTLTDFAGFLERAEDYSRTGILPVVAAKSSSRGKSPAPGVDMAQVRKEVEDLYARAASPEVTIEGIDEIGKKLEKLMKDELATIAQAIGLVGMSSKTKPVITSSIVGRIRSIKQSALRTSIIDR